MLHDLQGFSRKREEIKFVETTVLFLGTPLNI